MLGRDAGCSLLEFESAAAIVFKRIRTSTSVAAFSEIMPTFDRNSFIVPPHVILREARRPKDLRYFERDSSPRCALLKMTKFLGPETWKLVQYPRCRPIIVASNAGVQDSPC